MYKRLSKRAYKFRLHGLCIYGLRHMLALALASQLSIVPPALTSKANSRP